MFLMDKLGLPGRKTKILLRTMGQEKVADSCIASYLDVAGLDRDVYCEIPKLFVQHKMSVDRSNIPRQQDKEMASLERCFLSRNRWRSGDYDTSGLEPLEVIRSIIGGPYTVNMMLGK